LKVDYSGCKTHKKWRRWESLLVGGDQYSLDAKGRVSFPAKLREGLGESFVIVRGLDRYKCLWVYSEPEWKILEDKMRALPISQSRDIQMFLYKDAESNVVPDKQGRVLIPAKLREYAELNREVLVFGVSTHVEIWNSDIYGESYGNLTPGAMAEAMKALGF
jgi:MraZ protein